VFDISFTELMLVGVVALVVIGPEKLPKVARTVGHLLGRAQRYVNDVKGDIQREVELDELRKMKQEMESAAQSMQSSFSQTESELRQGLQAPIDEMKSLGDDLKDNFKDDLSDDLKDDFDYDYQPSLERSGEADKKALNTEKAIEAPAADALNGLGEVPSSSAKVKAVAAVAAQASPEESTQTDHATSTAPQEPKT